MEDNEGDSVAERILQTRDGGGDMSGVNEVEHSRGRGIAGCLNG